MNERNIEIRADLIMEIIGEIKNIDHILDMLIDEHDEVMEMVDEFLLKPPGRDWQKYIEQMFYVDDHNIYIDDIKYACEYFDPVVNLIAAVHRKPKAELPYYVGIRCQTLIDIIDVRLKG